MDLADNVIAAMPTTRTVIGCWLGYPRFMEYQDCAHQGQSDWRSSKTCIYLNLSNNHWGPVTNWWFVQSVPRLRPRIAGIGSSPSCNLNCRISGDKKWMGGLIIAHLLYYSGRCAWCQLAATAHKLPWTRRMIASIRFKSRGVLCIKWFEIKGGRQLAVNLTCQHE